MMSENDATQIEREEFSNLHVIEVAFCISSWEATKQASERTNGVELQQMKLCGWKKCCAEANEC